jgi:hypothetical protein
MIAKHLPILLVLGVTCTFARGDAVPEITAGDFDRLHRLIKPRPGESRWMEIDWYPSVWEARQKAAQQGKPLFLWAGSGGAPPAGC